MKKIKIVVTTASLLWISIFAYPNQTIYAANFEGNEEEWLNRCSIPQETAAKAQECAEFKSYYASLGEDLSQQADELNDQIASIKSNIDSIQDAVNKQNDLIKKIEKQIELNDASIRVIQEQIVKLQEAIKQKQSDIEKRNVIITERMINEQATTGTNTNIEIMMGAKDLIDLIRKMEGLQKITESDQEEIAKLVKEKEELDLQKKEQDRLKQNEEDQKKDNEKAKSEAEEVKKKKQELLSEYLKQEANLNQKMRSVKADMSALQSYIININTSVVNNINFSGNGSFLTPVNAPTSAGTWYYPASFGGGVHLGWDVAGGIGTPVYAPADSVVLYASNPAATNGGYLNNWVGWPLGGGNTIQILTQVDGTTYAISFFHLSQENFLVSPGQQVKKGQQIAATGNSGNTSGPHCHIEVVNLGSMSISSAVSTFQSTVDFAWGCGWGDAALSRTCDVSGAPCRERPENIFG